MSNRIFLHLVGVMTKELPRENFTNNEDNSVLPNLSYVTLTGGSVNLAELRTQCLAQLPDDMAPQVNEWIQHQKDSGGATDEVEVFEDNGVAPVLHIAFLEDTDGAMTKACEESQAKAAP